MTATGLSRLLAVIAEEYGIEFSEDRRAVWFATLADVDDEAAIRGFHAHLRGPRAGFRPHPGDVLAIAGIDRDDEAELAIAHLERWISDHQVVDLGPALNATVRALGGPDAVVGAICRGDWRFRRAEARRIFGAIRRRGVSGEDAEPSWPLTVVESEASRAFWSLKGIDPALFPGPFPLNARFEERPGTPALTTGGEGDGGHG